MVRLRAPAAVVAVPLARSGASHPVALLPAHLIEDVGAVLVEDDVRGPAAGVN
jgi:hypothetical protein